MSDGVAKRDHGGDLDRAVARYGGAASDWIDLSTGINRLPYPVPDVSADIWHRLPTAADMQRLTDAAASAYATAARILPVAGSQAAIQLIPRLAPAGTAAILGPTYNEHQACLVREGWAVKAAGRIDELAGADLAVVVNPNNPDGRVHQPDQLIALSRRVGLLVVDEAFADAVPEVSVAPLAGEPGVLVLRSFGKFYGLAGLRLGFVIGDGEAIGKLAGLAGPWQVSGAAIEVGCRALADTAWQRQTVVRLADDARRLDALAARRGWTLVGGSHLFRLYETSSAEAEREHLARHRIWSRIFPWSETFIRMGLPGAPEEWRRLEVALEDRAAMSAG